MNKISVLVFFSFLGCLTIGLAGCASNTITDDIKVAEELPELNCIAVLPASIPVAEDDVSTTERENLLKGADFLDTVLADELGGNEQFILLGQFQLDAILSDSWAGRVQQIQKISQSTRCRGVLETTLSRYRERVGSTMSADISAAGAFSMELLDGEKGGVLWSASFDEVQQALTENILSFKKAESRRFQWITAEELLRSGVQSRLAHFPYFMKTE